MAEVIATVVAAVILVAIALLLLSYHNHCYSPEAETRHAEDNYNN